MSDMVTDMTKRLGKTKKTVEVITVSDALSTLSQRD